MGGGQRDSLPCFKINVIFPLSTDSANLPPDDPTTHPTWFGDLLSFLRPPPAAPVYDPFYFDGRSAPRTAGDRRTRAGGPDGRADEGRRGVRNLKSSFVRMGMIGDPDRESEQERTTEAGEWDEGLWLQVTFPIFRIMP